ncbi:MAG: glycine oxidase [Sphingobacteriales bacterium]|jgi:glycine oxidase
MDGELFCLKHLETIHIIGQGIAGTILSYSLELKGIPYHVYDLGTNKGASHVAAGVFNPIVPKRLIPSWRAAEFLDFNAQFYPKFEAFLKSKFYHPTPFHKLLTPDELDFWNKKAAEEDSFLSPAGESSATIKGLSGNFFLGKINQSGLVDVQTMLKAWKDYLLSQNKLSLGSYKVGTNAMEIDCTGTSLSEPYQKALKPTKGEALLVSIPELKLDSIIKKQAFIVPLKDQQFWVGSTFNWKDISLEPTPDGRKELETKLRKMITVDYEVLEHFSGVRPTSYDRRAILKAPKMHELGVFNGLGTRGVLQSPTLSTWLIMKLLDDNFTLDKEIDYCRIKNN